MTGYMRRKPLVTRRRSGRSKSRSRSRRRRMRRRRRRRRRRRPLVRRRTTRQGNQGPYLPSGCEAPLGSQIDLYLLSNGRLFSRTRKGK